MIKVYSNNFHLLEVNTLVIIQLNHVYLPGIYLLGAKDYLDIQKLDFDAVSAIKDGDQGRFQELVERYQYRIIGLIGRQVGDRALAEDLMQDVFIRAFRGLKNFKGDCLFSTWLTRIALNVVKSYFVSKKHKSQKRTDSFDIAFHDRARSSEAEDEVIEEMKAALRSALQEVKPPFQEVMMLCGLEGKPYEEAADILGVPVGTIRSRLSRARIMVRDIMGVSIKELRKKTDIKEKEGEDARG